MNMKKCLNYPKSAAMGFFSKGLKNEFELATVNEPSVFEPLKFYCIFFAEKKNERSSCTAKASHIFQQNMAVFLHTIYLKI